MKIQLLNIFILITVRINNSNAISYNFVSAKCIDVNKEMFATELCAVKGSNFSLIVNINGTLNKIHVSLYVVST